MKGVDSPLSKSVSWRWAGILIFVGLPWALIYLLIAFGEKLPSEATLKNALFRSRHVVDTVAVGDSRVMRLSEEEFLAKGWAFFKTDGPVVE